MRPSIGRIATLLAVACATAVPLGAQTLSIEATVGTLSVAVAPAGIAISGDGRLLYVAERDRTAPLRTPDTGCLLPGEPLSSSSAGRIEVLDTATRTRVAILDGAAAGFPLETTVDPLRHVAYIARAASPDVEVIDAASGALLRTIRTGLTGSRGTTAIDPARRRLYLIGTGADEIVNNRIVNERVRVIDLATERPVADIVLPEIRGTRVDPATGRLWVLSSAHALVFDPHTLAEAARIPVGRCPSGLVFDTARRLAYVANESDQSISVIDMTRIPARPGALAAPTDLRAVTSAATASASWSSIPGAASYDLEIGTQPGLTDLLVLNTTGLGLTATLPSGTYYLRVRARRADGAASDPSNEASVTISTAAAGPPTLQPGTGLRPRVLVPCGYAIDPPIALVGAAGGTVTFGVMDPQGTACEWIAEPPAGSEFLSVTSGASGTGAGSVVVAVPPISGAPRIGTVLVDGTRVTVMQCAHAVTPASASVDANGGTLSFAVTTHGGCDWAASSNSAFLTVSAGASGSGNATVTVTAAANTGAARTGTVTIAGQTVTVAQSGAGGQCAYVVTPGGATAPANGGGLAFTITAQPACAWSAASQDSFLAITGVASGSGSGSVVVTASSNAGDVRSGTVTIAGQAVTVTQDAAGPASCALSVSPANVSVAADSANLTLTVNRTGGAGCNWTAVSNSSFLAVSGVASGVDDAPVVVTVAANTGSVRSGTLAIAGQTVTVTQDGLPSAACTYQVTPAGWNVWYGGDPLTFTVAVTQGTNCTWTAVSNSAFLTVAGMPPQTGGAVTVVLAPNTGPNAPARTGTLTIAGHTVHVNQASGCRLDVSPTSENAPIGGGTRVFVVTKVTGTGCSWTAESNTGFVTITGGTSGTDSGLVTISVAPNTGVGRTGSIRIAGRPITITQDQATACVFNVSPGTVAVPGSGGTRVFTVSPVQGTECPWTAVSNSPFLTITGGSSGTRSGTVTVLVAESDVESRSGTLLIAGQTITVNQSRTCTFDVAPAVATMPGTGGSTTFTITSVQGTGCTWIATSQSEFLTVASESLGTGSGSVTVRAASNGGATRSGTVTIADEIVTIVQDAAGCAFEVSPTADTVAASGGARIFTVTSTQGTGCGWTAASNSAFLTVTSGSSGTGSGAVTITASANAGAARPGTVTIAGRTITITQDAAAGCAFEVSPTPIVVGPSAAARTFTVTNTQGTGCTWTAVSNHEFLTVTAGSSGTGSGSVTVGIAGHGGTSQRSGTLTIAGQTVTVNQDPPPASLECLFSVSPREVTLSASGGTTVFTVTQMQGTDCPWNARKSNDSLSAFLTVISGASGVGSGTVTVSAPPRTSVAEERFGVLTIAGQRVTVSQAVTSCARTITPTNANVPAGGGTVTFTLAIPDGPGCGWGVTTNQGWVTNTSPGPPSFAGTGSAAVTFAVAPNTGAARFGSVSIAGDHLTITQAGNAPASCAYSVTPTTATVPAAGGNLTFTVTVTQGSNCSWTAGSNNSFLLITNGQGSGSGTVTVTASANSGGARSGTVTIAGQTVTVEQATSAACSYSITPTTASVGAGGGSATFTVTHAQGPVCGWTASSGAGFLTITGGASGTGNGAVTVSASANSGAARSGTVTIAGVFVTMTQDAAASVSCAYSVTPATTSVAASGGSATFTVTNTQGSGCSWTASSNAGFLTITGGASGTGNGTVTVSAAANSGVARSGTLTIAGQAVSVAQASAPAPACAFTVTPTSRQIPWDVSYPTFSVVNTQGTGCTWTAVSNANFLLVDNGASGTGNGVVTVKVEHNLATNGSNRSGTLTIAGQTVTVTQEGPPCYYSLTPSLVNVPAPGGTAAFSVKYERGANCSWEARSHDSFLTITNGTSGTGSGTVTVTVGPNNGTETREGAISISLAGPRVQTYLIGAKVRQPYNCLHDVSPWDASAPAGGGTLTFALNFTPGSTCSWTATSSQSWVTISSPASGTGSGSVTVTVAPNTGAARSADLIIRGLRHRIAQAGS